MPAGFLPIPGLKIGHAHDEAALTGCTVLLCEGGMVAACEVRGGAVGERELETLRPGHLVERIHALVFTGGSAFGLDAAAGIMRWCEERGIGFDTGVARVPIVPAAVLFDLRLGDPTRRPDAAMGYAAAQAAVKAPVAEGNVGAGTGLSVGKLFGIARAVKSGIGCWTEELPGFVGQGGIYPDNVGSPDMEADKKVGASAPEAESRVVRVSVLAAVNAFGDVRDPDTGKIIAGARVAEDSREFADTAASLRRGVVRRGFADPNTVLVAVATNAMLTRLEAQRLAAMASAGVARVLSPAHTTFDGDIVFALSVSPEASGEKADINALGAAAAEAVAHAIVRSVTQARGAGGLPAVSN
jgi:L-aminopeptidase/D-esterase-like protein